MKHEEGVTGDSSPAVLAYAAAPPVRAEWSDDGRRFVLLLPVRAVWPIVAWQATVILLWLAIAVAGLAGFVMSYRAETGGSGMLCCGVSTAASVFLVTRVLEVVRLAKSQRMCGVVEVSADGVKVMTSWSGRTRRYRFPAERLAWVTVARDTPSVIGQVPLKLLAVARDHEGINFEFTAADRETADALQKALQAYLSEPSSRGPVQGVFWVRVRV